MFRFSIRDMLYLMIVGSMGCALRADEPGPTLKDLIRQASDKPTSKTQSSYAVRHALSYHSSPNWRNRTNILVISWFRGGVGSLLRYKVAENGQTDNVRDIFNHASQN
jgi:hypothetical protein